MNRTALIRRLTQYRNGPYFLAEEQAHHDELLQLVTTHADCFERERAGHITGSAWLIDHGCTHVLLTHHKKLNWWLQLGGHADGDPDVAQVALKEAHEESGTEGLKLISSAIFDIDVHSLPTTCVKHYDIRYLVQAPPDAQYVVSEESHDLAWVPLKKLSEYTTSRSVVRMAEKMVLLRL